MAVITNRFSLVVLKKQLLATLTAIFSMLVFSDQPVAADEVRLAVFDIDVTPDVGYEMAYDPVVRVDAMTLRCRGIVLFSDGDPIVFCAVDWIGIANESHDLFRTTLADAAGTTAKRVAVHTLHQHDAPVSDVTTESLLRDAGAVQLKQFDSGFTRSVLERLSTAVRQAVESTVPVTHYGWGAAEVTQVASNRRILGPDGKVRATRYTATRDPKLRAEPEGVIDPEVSLLSFWNEDTPVAVLSWYACHPQSYYRVGIPSPDFPGIARFMRQQSVPKAVHIHFNGAGGNIGAGKYNDGSPENRMVLASRLADGMRRAWEATERKPIESSEIALSVLPVSLPPAEHLDETALRSALASDANSAEARLAADKLSWLLRCRHDHQIELQALRVGDVRVLHMPGELFVEYQLAAKQMRPDLHVAMAAYGDYGPGYIGTEIAYEQGGYEASARASDVSPKVEAVLMRAMKELLEVSANQPTDADQ